MSLPRTAPAQTQRLDLAALIAPLSVSDFLTQYWRKKILHRQGATELLGALQSILGSFDVPHLARLASSVTAMDWKNGVTERQDYLPVDQALQFYERGYTLYFNLHDTMPACQAVMENVLKQAGITPVASYCSIFASKVNGGLRTHYDQNENFTVQLAGQKTWTIWPNTLVENPIHSYRRGEMLLAPEAAMHIDPSVRHADLGEGEDVDMSPGSMLYHPAGSWHTTKAGAESVSFNICIQPATFYDLMLGAVAARLTAPKDVREPLPPFFGGEDMATFKASLAAAIAATQETVAAISAEDAAAIRTVPRGLNTDIAGAARRCAETINADTKLTRTALAAFDIEETPTAMVLWVHLLLGRLTNRVKLRVPDALKAACLSAVNRRDTFAPQDLAGGAAAAIEVCRALVAMKALRLA